MREIKLRCWDKLHERMFPAPFKHGAWRGENLVFREDDIVAWMQFTGLKDNTPQHADIYEGDIINSAGEVVGNLYESPQVQQDGITHTVANMGTDAWRESESIAMGRGCKYAQ